MQSPATLRSEIPASVDPLTGLSDRGAFDAAFEAQLQSHPSSDLPLSVALLEVDYFKPYAAACGEPETCTPLARAVALTERASTRAPPNKRKQAPTSSSTPSGSMTTAGV